jgi:hypothetical protein
MVSIIQADANYFARSRNRRRKPQSGDVHRFAKVFELVVLPGREMAFLQIKPFKQFSRAKFPGADLFDTVIVVFYAEPITVRNSRL